MPTIYNYHRGFMTCYYRELLVRQIPINNRAAYNNCLLKVGLDIVAMV
jgi:hypothetical protein